MTQDEIIRMAREAGAEATHYQTWGDVYEFDMELLERFAALVAAREREKHSNPSWETVDDAIAAEREACAKVCESFKAKMDAGLDHVAAAIRARGENGTA